MTVYVTGTAPGSYVNTIPPGALTTDTDTNVTNRLPATDTLVISDTPRGGGGKGKDKNKPSQALTIGLIIPVTGFAPGKVTNLDDSPRSVYDVTSLTIEIPVIGVKADIVGVESTKGSWDVSWLQNEVGWLNGTAYPTRKGNSLLTAHVVNADGKPGVFYRLKSLGIGEYIYIYNAGYRYTYQVVSNTLVQPNDARVMGHQEKSFLTLITCDSYDEKTGTYLKRVAVGAKLVDVRSSP
jgi:LPXTG-site transpeptidase (sortase) family protein